PEHFYETIIQYRKRLSRYHSYYEQLINMGYFVQSSYGQKLTPEEKNLWQLYVKRAERLHDHVEMLREYLIQIRELYQSLIAVQQNKVMSFLTIVTTIFLPLTLIAGWYGMNFPNMPEFRWKYSYLAVIIISLMVIVLEIFYFKKKKML
ncbi:MAG: cobalt transporter, partial [Roseburia sp.]|nr:cobalt transporter [Roseburia sp.]